MQRTTEGRAYKTNQNRFALKPLPIFQDIPRPLKSLEVASDPMASGFSFDDKLITKEVFKSCLESELANRGIQDDTGTMEYSVWEDDDEQMYEDDSDYTKKDEGIDRGGQFHLQSAILPVKSILPYHTASRYQERLIQKICDAADNHMPSFQQIKLFNDYMLHCESSPSTGISSHVRMMAMGILKRECEVFESLLQEPHMTTDILHIVKASLTNSSYPNHISMVQRAVYVYNILLSRRLGDDDLKTTRIKHLTKGKGDIDDEHMVVSFQYEENGWKIYITRELIGWERNNSLTITTPAILLNICDKLQERFNIQTITEIGNKISPLIYPSWAVTRRMIAWGDNVIQDLGNEGYGLLANFESIMVSQIIKNEQGGFDNGRFQGNVINDIVEDALYMMPHIQSLLDMISPMSHFHIAQLHGLYRIWGHPEVDSEAGMRKVGDLLRLEKHADKDLEEAGKLTFREVFMMNYFTKHGYYPPVKWTVTKETDKGSIHKSFYYVKAKVDSSMKIDTSSIYYDKAGWKYMEFLPCFPLPTGLNIASFLKDKAVSPNRGDLVDMIVSNNRVTDPYKRRGVLKWLTSQPIDITRLLEAINANPQGLPADDRTIGLYPKERELKLQARMFALMSYKMRIYFVTTEEMLSHHVLPYFPQIAMNDNFLDIQKKFVDFTTPMTGKDNTSITYIVNIDFKKWNQQMRRNITLGIFTDLGSMFGLPELYNRTYDIFNGTFVYLCNGTYTPTVRNNRLVPHYPLSWEGDQGGKEGLRQKGWTIVSAMDLYCLCKEHGFTFKIIGGGDNQVLVITMPSADGNRERTHRRMERFLEDMDDKMRRRGLPLKIGETWVSSSLFAYNKYMIYKGVQLPSTLKLASRCFHLSNTDLMTIENMMSTLAVTHQSIISKDFSCLVGWLFSRINLAIHADHIWDHHPFLGVSIPETLQDSVQLSGVRGKTTFKNELTKTVFYWLLILFPRVLGGSGTINLFSFLSRGFPDGLSEWCSYLYKMEGVADHAMNRVIKKILLPTKRSMPSYSRLIEDPTCLSLDSAEIGSGALRNIALDFIEKSDKITNTGFKQFLSLSSRDEAERLAETLCSNNVILPRELHDIMGSTIYGYMSSIMAKIDKSTTINKLGDGNNVLNMIRETERNWINYCAYRLTVSFGMGRLSCPTRTAEKWRNESWQKKIVGVTTPHPTAFLVSCPGRHHDSCDGNFILHINLYRKGVDDVYQCAGPCNPYLGSYTREKSLGTELASAFGNESLVRRPIHLQKLIGWRYERDGCMAKIIRKCLESVTDVPGEFFESDPRCITGDAEHRYKDKATKHEGVINNLYYWSSWLRTLTDSFVKHSRGGKNETLQFQTCMLYINALSSMINDGSSGELKYFIRLKLKHIGEVHYHESCPDCIIPLEQPEEKDSAPRKFPPIPTCPQNPYLYIRRDSMTFSYSDLQDMNEAANTEMVESITESYDGRVALSLITGSMLGRKLTGSTHSEERLTESSWRMIMGKVEPSVMFNGLVNYLISWKFFTVMARGDDVTSMSLILEDMVNQRSTAIHLFIEMMLSYPSQRRALQSWCQNNDTAIALKDIEVGSLIQEILARIQINSNRTRIQMLKTRGENISKEEKVIRVMMGMHYVAADCSECQNYLRQYLKNNVMRNCLCPHEELRSSLSLPTMVWPEGIESLSKKISLNNVKMPSRLTREGYPFALYDIHSVVRLSTTGLRCLPVEVSDPKLVHVISNFPIIYQVCSETCLATRETEDELYIIDSYDGILENMLSRYMVSHERVRFVRLFRYNRPEYYMMDSYMTGDMTTYRVEDLVHYSVGRSILIIECSDFHELSFFIHQKGSFYNIYIFQVHIMNLVSSVKWLSSWTTGFSVKVARLSEDVVSVVLSKYEVKKKYSCIDPTASDAVISDLKCAIADIQSKRYKTWGIVSGDYQLGTISSIYATYYGRGRLHDKTTVDNAIRSVITFCGSLRRRGEKEQVDTLLHKFLYVTSSLLDSPWIHQISRSKILSVMFPNKITMRTIKEEDNYYNIDMSWEDIDVATLCGFVPNKIDGADFLVTDDYLEYSGIAWTKRGTKRRLK